MSMMTIHGVILGSSGSSLMDSVMAYRGAYRGCHRACCMHGTLLHCVPLLCFSVVRRRQQRATELCRHYCV